MPCSQAVQRNTLHFFFTSKPKTLQRINLRWLPKANLLSSKSSRAAPWPIRIFLFTWEKQPNRRCCSEPYWGWEEPGMESSGGDFAERGILSRLVQTCHTVLCPQPQSKGNSWRKKNTTFLPTLLRPQRMVEDNFLTGTMVPLSALEAAAMLEQLGTSAKV